MILYIAYSYNLFRCCFGIWIRCNSHIAIAKEKEEIEPYKECINTTIYTAIALQSIRLF